MRTAQLWLYAVMGLLALLLDTPLGAQAAWEVAVPGAVPAGSKVTRESSIVKGVPMVATQPASVATPAAVSTVGIAGQPAKPMTRRVPTPREAAPKTRQVTASVAPEARKYLKDKCVALGKNDVPPAPLVLGAFSKDGRLGSVYPRKQDVFVHRNINRPPCPASANHCLSNFTVLRSPEEFIGKFRWDRCAIVGNSGSLLATRYGPAIDSHDLVVRMNIAPTAGKETYVGKKTNLRMINSKWVRMYSQGSNMVGVGPKVTLVVRVVDHTRWYALLYRSMLRRRPDVTVLLLNTHSVRASQRILEAYRLCYLFNGRRFEGGTIPSSGFVLVMALSQMCEQVNVYGFGRPKYQGKLVPYQYYIERNQDGSINQGSQNHAFVMELLVLKEIARSSGKRINFCGIEQANTPECRLPPTAG